MPLSKFRDGIRRKLDETHKAAQSNIPAENLKNQAPGYTLPPTGNTGSGYTPGDGSVTTTKLVDDVVTFAKFQNITTDRLLGRDTAGTGDVEELTVSGGVEFTGSGGVQRSALTGDVTASAGSGSTTIPNDTVTYAKMQNVSAASKLIGRGDSGSGDPQEITLGTGLSMSGATLSSSGGGSSLTVEELDGSPTDSAVTKIVFPNGTLGIASHVATYTPSGGGGMTDPTTTLGDLIVNDGSGVDRLGVGSDGDVLTADSGEALGMKWAAPVGGSGMEILSVQADSSSSDGGTPVSATQVPDLTLTIAGSGTARRALVSYSFAYTSSHPNHVNLFLDTTIVFPKTGAASFPGTTDAADSIYSLGPSDSSQPTYYSTLAEYVVTIPGDSASHDIKVKYSAALSTVATVFYARSLVVKLIADSGDVTV